MFLLIDDFNWKFGEYFWELNLLYVQTSMPLQVTASTTDGTTLLSSSEQWEQCNQYNNRNFCFFILL